jgi:hypothetical protein
MDNDKVPHTFAAFRSRHYMATGTTPSEQEIFDAGMRAGRDLQWAKRATEAKPSASAYERCTHAACGRFKDGASWNCHAMEHNSCARPSASAAPGIKTWKERFADQFPRFEVEHCPSDMMACLMAEEIADLRAAIAAAREEEWKQHGLKFKREADALWKRVNAAEAEVLDLRARLAAPAPVKLEVWYGPMPESNGKSNFTATLKRKSASMFDTDSYTFQQSEYPDRVRYEADCMRYLIGDLAERPDILDYDADKHSGYIAPQPQAKAPQQPPAGEDA